MIVYFADRQMNTLGMASTGLPNGVTIIDDLKTEDIETGVSIFECRIPFDKNTRLKAESWAEVGNYILRSDGDKNEFYQIIESEVDTKKQEIYIYAEDDGMELLNEVVGPYKADKAYPITHYISMYASAAGFVVGINEVPGLTRKLSWDGESTATARIASVATQFDGCEVSYSFDVDGLFVTKKFINIYKKRSRDNGVTMRLNREIDRIVTKKSIANIATALYCTGSTPDPVTDDEGDVTEFPPVTLEGYRYDDGEDFYVDGPLLKSRKALQRWSRILWRDDGTEMSGGHVVKQYSYDTLSQQTLCTNAITKLKSICDMEVNYEVEIPVLPPNVIIGDRVNLVDDEGELYLSTRILKLETSVINQSVKVTLGEHLLKNSGIHEKVIELAEQFAKLTKSVLKANAVTSDAKAMAEYAQEVAEQAAMEAVNAQVAAISASEAESEATLAAETAMRAADEAQESVESVETTVQSLITSVSNAQAAADNAYEAAELAEAKADEAAQKAEEAKAAAQAAAVAVGAAESKAEEAIAKAGTAQTTANEAKTDAETAKSTANAAKEDAEQAQEDIDSLSDSLETFKTTVQAEYARKTDLTETEASLQTQISQNAAEISSTATKVQTIDETANDAQAQAQEAKTKADNAKEQADQATADAQAAQAVADEAAAAAATAQSKADTAKAAAETAQSVADKAEADLEAAKADLATVTSRVDATEEEIAAAQTAVETAQTAANLAKTKADAAAETAAEAQSIADAAVLNATDAQTIANDAVTQASAAQKLANEAKGDASEAQATAAEAVSTAEEAQRTANTAKTDAENAQATADQAAANAASAQAMADDADAKAAQAAADLATAQQNLADVVSRVDATEEEVEAAQTAVIAAQAAADTAQEEAEAAQSTADAAKTNAAAAQAAADNAKTAADNAQDAADDAQRAADDAQAAVDALAVRVTTAETKITQNSEQIALMASKTYVEQTLGGYYKKEETEAAIQIESDSIKSEVSATYTTKDEAADISEVANAATERVTTAESLIQQLSNCIEMLVTDENGESLMTQTENGWTFSMKETSEAVSSLTSLLETLQQETGSTKATVDTLVQAVADHGEALEYVTVTTYEDEPCIELGESDSDFKLMITNTRIMFMNGSNIPTYINTNGLVTQNIEVKGEIVQGGYVMLNTADGGWGLLWKGVSG